MQASKMTKAIIVFTKVIDILTLSFLRRQESMLFNEKNQRNQRRKVLSVCKGFEYNFRSLI